MSTLEEKTRLTIADLKPKMELNGRVTRVELFGAMVDIGAEHDAMLHISQFGKERVYNASDVLSEGDEITVWVHKVDPERGRVELTMVRPLDVEWSEIRKGQVYTGTVTRIEKFGAFVDIGAERPGLVHISELSTSFVSSPTEVVNVGDTVEVMVLDVNRKKHQIDLSIKALEEARASAEEEEEEHLPTAMELALRRALERSAARKSEEQHTSEDSGQAARAEQDDILARTLQQRKE